MTDSAVFRNDPVLPPPAVVSVTPSPAVRRELELALEGDDQLLGDVWRRRRAGETAEQIQAARSASRPNFVWNYERVLKALLEGDLPSAPTLALQSARALRGFLARTTLSSDAQTVLRVNIAALDSAAGIDAAREVEDKEARVITTAAEAQAIPGVYVYALPHYLRYPFDAESGRTLLKVGHSNRSVLKRFQDQTRTTALPEDPVLLRIYSTLDEDSVLRERQFHDLLVDADHARSDARTGGTEWFLTSLKYLDRIAQTLGLEIRHIYDAGSD